MNLTICSGSHTICFLVPSKDSSLLAIFPRAHPDPPLPLENLFILLAILVHLNLAALLHAEFVHRHNIQIIPHPISYGLSALAPCLCVLLGRSWQTTVWWSLTGVIVFIIHIVQRSIALGHTALLELERLKYMARGA